SMSTLSSLVLTSSSTITLDFIGQFAKINEKKKLICLRVFVAFFIVVSAAIAILQYKSSVAFIAQLMGVSWGALAGSFLAPFLYGLFMKKVTKSAVWASFITGVGITGIELYIMITKTAISNPVLNYFFSTPINAGVLAMVVGLIIVPLVSLMTPKMNKEDVDEMFSCYDDKVTVDITEALGD
ncbi:MAG: sodium:solute symporter, partial [Clostridia bacterium]|nr:sodium:solute symporter [Clostridia bacterium]